MNLHKFNELLNLIKSFNINVSFIYLFIIITIIIYEINIILQWTKYDISYLNHTNACYLHNI